MILALAVAVLPAVGGAVGVVKASEVSIAASAPDCCEHHGGPCDQDTGSGMADDCAAMAACATHCFNFTGLFAADLSYSPIEAVRMASIASPAVASHVDRPPSPPPRV